MKKKLYFATTQNFLSFEYISLKIVRLLTDHSKARIVKLSIYFNEKEVIQDFYFFYDFNVEGLLKFTDDMTLTQILNQDDFSNIKIVLKMTELIANDIRENFLNSKHLPQHIFNDRNFYCKDHFIVKPHYKFHIAIEYKTYEKNG